MQSPSRKTEECWEISRKECLFNKAAEFVGSIPNLTTQLCHSPLTKPFNFAVSQASQLQGKDKALLTRVICFRLKTGFITSALLKHFQTPSTRFKYRRQLNSLTECASNRAQCFLKGSLYGNVTFHSLHVGNYLWKKNDHFFGLGIFFFEKRLWLKHISGGKECGNKADSRAGAVIKGTRIKELEDALAKGSQTASDSDTNWNQCSLFCL